MSYCCICNGITVEEACEAAQRGVSFKEFLKDSGICEGCAVCCQELRAIYKGVEEAKAQKTPQKPSESLSKDGFTWGDFDGTL